MAEVAQRIHTSVVTTHETTQRIEAAVKNIMKTLEEVKNNITTIIASQLKLENELSLHKVSTHTTRRSRTPKTSQTPRTQFAHSTDEWLVKLFAANPEETKIKYFSKEDLKAVAAKLKSDTKYINADPATKKTVAEKKKAEKDRTVIEWRYLRQIYKENPDTINAAFEEAKKIFEEQNKNPEKIPATKDY